MKKIYLSTKFSSKHDIFSSLVAQTVKNLSAVQETRIQSLGCDDPPGEGNSPWTEEPGSHNPWVRRGRHY